MPVCRFYDTTGLPEGLFTFCATSVLYKKTQEDGAERTRHHSLKQIVYVHLFYQSFAYDKIIQKL